MGNLQRLDDLCESCFPHKSYLSRGDVRGLGWYAMRAIAIILIRPDQLSLTPTMA